MLEEALRIFQLFHEVTNLVRVTSNRVSDVSRKVAIGNKKES
ncbi:hypothetical protein MADA3029_1090025 [Vibrio nigripulchritudo MADA3029]|nr:hypothetical protein VIBNIMADA3021_1150024 [Vibrio nigripulchritudo MADA3021]CCN57275.1 hypothetical protein MADA3029_1090025 [Vibrio nigripulchritudo MADA3029]